MTPMHSTTPRGRWVTIHLTTEERADWERRAKADGRPLSAWVRRQVQLQIQVTESAR